MPFDVTQHLNLEIQTRPAKFLVACVADRRKGVRKVKMSAGSEGKGTACKDAIVFFVFYVHKMNVKILIGQI